ncbi:hypothetical protein JXK06_02430 [Patescibacteria group bacterium]|nr:hypothetical protein [Patescibacteria group bacterium]
MEKEKDINENNQENNQELLEQGVEENPFNPENSFEKIKEAAFEQGEAKVEQAESELENDLELFTEAVEGEDALIANLEQIKNEAQGKISETDIDFKTKLETIDASKENVGIEKEQALKEVGQNFAALKSLEKKLKQAKSSEEIAELKEQIINKEEALKNSESIFEEALAGEIENEIRNNPEANDLSHLEKILIPGFSALAEEKLKAVSAEKDPGFVNKVLKFVGKHSPKSHLGKTLTVAAIVAGGAIAFGGTGGLPLAYALGSKIGRSLAGSLVGEKVGELVGKKMEQVSEKKKNKRLSEGLDGSIKTMIQLAQKEAEIGAKQAKIRGMAKFGAHLLTAGGIMSGLKLAEYGAIELIKQGAEHGAQAATEAAAHAAETAADHSLSAHLLYKSSYALDYGFTIAPIDYVGEKVINKAGSAHNPNAAHH